MKTNILLIDNYDSFTYNLAQYFWELGYTLTVIRNDQITIQEIQSFNPSHIVISPGPGTPEDSGISLQVLKEFSQQKPILGVCLGHQCLGQFFGAKVERAVLPKHGKTSLIEHNQDGIFKDIPNPFRVTRYHSLIVTEDTLKNTDLTITSRSTEDGLVMSLQHKTLPIYGVQFHPESIMTEYGHTMLKNFVELTIC
jgi:anthranilate synthase component 2